MPPNPIATVEDLRVTYKTTHVLDGLDLTVSPGEVLGLLGPNGGGKSTLLLTMAGLIKPTSGRVTIQGVDAHRMALDATGTVGLITATPGLYPLLTGWENLEFFGALYGLSKAETRRRTQAFIDELGLSEHLNKRVATGSSGMQQKISLTRALLMDPPLLLLDEPTSNLDPISAQIIFRTAREHADRGKAVVWVSHDLPAAEQICDRVALVKQRILDEKVFDGERRVPNKGPLLEMWHRHLGATP